MFWHKIYERGAFPTISFSISKLFGCIHIPMSKPSSQPEESESVNIFNSCLVVFIYDRLCLFSFSSEQTSEREIFL